MSTPFNILRDFFSEAEVATGDIQKLLRIKRGDNPVFTSDSIDLLYEIIGVIRQLNQEGKPGIKIVLDTIAEVQTRPSHLPLDYYYETPVFKILQDTYARDVIRLRDQIDVQNGIEECPKCRGKRTVTIQSQTRSADEAATSKSTCYDCHNKWQSSN